MFGILQKHKLHQLMTDINIIPHLQLSAGFSIIPQSYTLTTTYAMLATVTTAILGLFLIWWFFLPRLEEPALVQSNVVDPETCAKIVACNYNDDSGNSNALTKVQSRAYPNRRLVRAFNIDNAFTTTDDTYRKSFRNLATDKIKVNDGKWKHIAKLAQELVSGFLLRVGREPNNTRLDHLVQIVSLKISLYVLFDKDPLALDDSRILEIATCINTLWVESKVGQPDPENKRRLETALRQIQLHTGPDSRSNPLNLILPAYETLWRVVIFCFIEVTFRDGAHSIWRRTLEAFLSNPIKFKFEHSEAPGSVSAANIINEALRLYPPTRRVHRQFQTESKPTPEILAADIEACHRNAAIWGDDSLRFNPSRWANNNHLSDESRRAFMPFGTGIFTCPAKQEFGPRMIGILVAALVANIDRRDWRFELSNPNAWDAGGRSELVGAEPLVSQRGEYESMMIIRRPS